jgi:branched-subunit amino acid aminotransferase/4-amino-4-deoxychorismate lyase
LHRQRLLRAAAFFKWDAVQSIACLRADSAWEEYLTAKVQDYLDRNEVDAATPLRYRIAVNNEGVIRVEFFAISPTTLEALFPARLPPPDELAARSDLVSIILDPEQTQVTPYTYQKTTLRAHYDAARQRMTQILADCTSDRGNSNSEIILQNPRGEVTEGSVTNVYVWRNGWVTPPVGPESGGLEGTARTFAFERGLCREERVLMDSIQIGDVIWISNGVRGFSAGVVVYKP